MADKASPAPSSESGSAADVSIMVDESVAESKPSEPNSQYGSIISDSDYLTPREGAEGGAESKYGSVEDDEQAISTATSSHGTDNESTFSTDIPGLNGKYFRCRLVIIILRNGKSDRYKVKHFVYSIIKKTEYFMQPLHVCVSVCVSFCVYVSLCGQCCVST